MDLLVNRRGVDGDDPSQSVGKRTGGTCLEGARIERGYGQVRASDGGWFAAVESPICLRRLTPQYVGHMPCQG
jgi:hypothetical protein